MCKSSILLSSYFWLMEIWLSNLLRLVWKLAHTETSMDDGSVTLVILLLEQCSSIFTILLSRLLATGSLDRRVDAVIVAADVLVETQRQKLRLSRTTWTCTPDPSTTCTTSIHLSWLHVLSHSSTVLECPFCSQLPVPPSLFSTSSRNCSCSMATDYHPCMMRNYRRMFSTSFNLRLSSTWLSDTGWLQTSSLSLMTTCEKSLTLEILSLLITFTVALSRELVGKVSNGLSC